MPWSPAIFILLSVNVGTGLSEPYVILKEFTRTIPEEHRNRVERVGDGVGEGDRGQIMLGPVRHVLFYSKINRSLFQGCVRRK